MLARKALAGTAGAAKEYVEDVFSTYLYTGNGSTRTITNSIDLSGKGGLVWIKNRSSAVNHALVDTERGAGQYLSSNTTTANTSTSSEFTGFTSSGFGLDSLVSSIFNGNTERYTSWTFRKAKKFFDVVTYTGTGSARTVSHNLGSTPGCIIVKRTDASANWNVYHRSINSTKALVLNSTVQADTDTSYWNNTEPTSTVFTVGTSATTNANGASFVAYLFAHDAGGFGDAGSDSIIKCGSYTGNGSAPGPTITLDWEPQWIMIKRTDSTGNWFLYDNMRGWPVGSDARELYANDSYQEDASSYNPWITSTGFYPRNADSRMNASGGTYIYIAIRKGPMKTPETGTSVFTPTAFSGNDTSGTRSAGLNAFDLLITKRRDGAADFVWLDKLRGLAGNRWLSSASSSAEVANGGTLDTINTINGQYTQDGINITKTSNYSYIDSGGYNFVWYALKRAPKFFDQVCYTGNGTSNRAITHNLGVTPELIIVKDRSAANLGMVYTADGGNGKFLRLFDGGTGTYPYTTNSSPWNNTSPTSTQFTVDGSGGYQYVNANGNNYVAYLFATLAGVSKVGSYTGTGSPININCGFTNGARFVLIKQTDSADNWYVWDTARGIVTGNEKYLQLNKTDVESTAADEIDPYSAGFTVNSLVNTNGASYIYLAIA